MYTGPDFPPDAFTHVNNKQSEIQQIVRENNNNKMAFVPIKENVCIKMNTRFIINLLVIKKNVNLYIGREMQTAVTCYDEGMMSWEIIGKNSLN